MRDMEVEGLQHISVALYRYLCQHIVGSEEMVRIKRILSTIDSNLQDHTYVTEITSGSFGEGLEMKGSDFDLMHVFKILKVRENISNIPSNPSKTYFQAINDGTKPGFVKLLLLNRNDRNAFNLCVKFNGGMYLSNQLLKTFYKSTVSRYHVVGYYATEVDHGPCLSDAEGMFDFAICLHSKSWISQANQWLTRGNQSWPRDDVKLTILDHGVLFVPIGVKGSRNEEIEWRISFSVGEKFLVYSFTHTQLLCYALMKIVLKDIICTHECCKNLLCSYYIKTIMFWVSEEWPLSEWKPENLIPCFMRCFRRLIYCVEYSICPHYFIQENNLFENKIEGQSRRNLLNTLKTLYVIDWRFLLFSPQLQDFLSASCVTDNETQLFINNLEHLNVSSVLAPFTKADDHYRKAIKMLLSYSSPSSKLCHQYCLSRVCRVVAGTVHFSDRNKNKETYANYKLCQSYLLQNLHHDAVSGWLQLASLYYTMKQYRRALRILTYSLSKCSHEKLLRKTRLSCTQRELLKWKSLQSKGIIRILKLLRSEEAIFSRSSTLIPRELELEVYRRTHLIPPVVYAYFLSFLCNFHLGDTTQIRNSLKALHLTILEGCFISHPEAKSTSYNCLGVAFKLVRDGNSAIQAFCNALMLDPKGLWSCARQRICMIKRENLVKMYAVCQKLRTMHILCNLMPKA